MSPLVSLPEYETFVYGLQQQFSVIQRTTLVVVRRGEADTRDRDLVGVGANVRATVARDHRHAAG